MTNLFFRHLATTRDLLLAFDDSFIGEALNRTNLGSAREALTSNFLIRNLPSAIEYPSGEIFDAKGKQSGQVDLILLPNSSPKLHLFGAITLAPVDTVLGVVEVKSALTTGETGELTVALRHCAKLKELRRSQSMSVSFLSHDGEFPTCPYILFAFRGGHADTVISQLESMKAEIGLGSMPDLIVVLQHDYVLAKSASWVNIDATAASVYHQGKPERPALFYLYSFVIGLVDYWTTHPGHFHLPQEEYVETLASLDFLFEE